MFRYKFSYLEAHFGCDDSYGPEHTLDGQTFPYEFQFVHFNNKYSSVDEAFTKSDGLAVLSLFVTVIDT